METVIGSVILSVNGMSSYNRLVPCDGRSLDSGANRNLSQAWSSRPGLAGFSFKLPDLRAVVPYCRNTRLKMIYSTPIDYDFSALSPPNVARLCGALNADRYVTIGTISFLSTQANRIPPGAIPCDGRELEIQKYQGLYACIGNRFSVSSSPQNQFFGLPRLVSPLTSPLSPVGGYFIYATGVLGTASSRVDWGYAPL